MVDSLLSHQIILLISAYIFICKRYFGTLCKCTNTVCTTSVMFVVLCFLMVFTAYRASYLRVFCALKASDSCKRGFKSNELGCITGSRRNLKPSQPGLYHVSLSGISTDRVILIKRKSHRLLCTHHLIHLLSSGLRDNGITFHVVKVCPIVKRLEMYWLFSLCEDTSM